MDAVVDVRFKAPSSISAICSLLSVNVLLPLPLSHIPQFSLPIHRPIVFVERDWGVIL